MKIYTYSLLSPGGNNTALVNGIIKNPILRKSINDAILKAEPTAEQVGFINNGKNDKYKLLMAGEEFCGNSVRSAAFIFLKGKSGEIKIRASGALKKMSAGIDNQMNAWAQMPAPSKDTILEKKGLTIIKMEGITHVIVKNSKKTTSSENLKTYAKTLLHSLNLLKTVPASGVLFINKKNKIIELEPIVWVRDIKTFFYETACGSGTTAVGLLEAMKIGRSVSVPVRQPSGKIINASITLQNGQCTWAQISGPVCILKSNRSVSI